MPAYNSVAIVVILIASASTMLPMAGTRVDTQPSVSQSAANTSGLEPALHWLSNNQSSDGSYGAFLEHWTAAAAYALWLNDTSSTAAKQSYGYLASQLDGTCPSSWFWKNDTAFCPGEADVPGEVLFSIALSQNLALVNSTFVTGQLLALQSPASGGFEGYSYCSSNCDSATPTYLTVASSVDTDMALLGLDSANIIPTQNRTLAVHYLLSLQNPDGSYNLTSTIRSDSLYSLGPDPVSITALTLLALKSAGLTLNDFPVSSGLGFLSEKTLANLCSGGRTYSMALATIAFKAYDQQDDAIRSSTYIVSQQNIDGGFSDATRSYYPESNALDTGWAAIALGTEPLISGNTPEIKNCPPLADFSFSPETPTTQVSVHFDASTSSNHYGDQLAYNWTFGDGSSASGMSATHKYSETGNFTVTLTVIDPETNPGSLSDTKSVTLNIQPATVQKSSTLPFSSTIVWIMIGAVGLVAVAGVAFYLGRRSGRIPTIHSV